MFGWIEYCFSDSKDEELFGEDGGHEVYVPGFVRSEVPGDNYFMPVIWQDKRDEIRDIVVEETGATRITWRPKDRYFEGDTKRQDRNLRKEVFDIALMENEIDLTSEIDRETGVEKWTETDTIQMRKSGNAIYGYIKEHTRQPDMDLDEPVETEAEIIGRVEPYGELGEMPEHDKYFDVAQQIVSNDNDLDALDDIGYRIQHGSEL